MARHVNGMPIRPESERATPRPARRVRALQWVATTAVMLVLASGVFEGAPAPREVAVQPVAARALPVLPSRVLTGLSSEALEPPAESRSGQSREERAERRRARKEAAKAKREAARERRASAAQERREARLAKREERESSSQARRDAKEEKRAAARERHAAAVQERREAAEARKAAKLAKREEALARRDDGSDSRREAAEARKEARLAKREEARARHEAAAQERREAAEARKQERVAKREAARERYAAAVAARREAKEAKLEAAREKREMARAGREPAPVENRALASSAFGTSGSGLAGGAVPAGNGGILRINSLPWAQVFVDGQLVGYTPQRSIRVSPGDHDVRLVNPMFAMRKALHVKVGQGQQVTERVILEE